MQDNIAHLIELKDGFRKFKYEIVSAEVFKY